MIYKIDKKSIMNMSGYQTKILILFILKNLKMDSHDIKDIPIEIHGIFKKV